MVLQITALALMQEVATRSVALPRNARRFSCGASLLSQIDEKEKKDGKQKNPYPFESLRTPYA